MEEEKIKKKKASHNALKRQCKHLQDESGEKAQLKSTKANLSQL